MSDMVYTVGAEQMTAFFVPFRLPVLIFFSVVFPFIFLLESFSLWRMAKNCQIPGRWMAFVPFLQMVIRGRLAEFPFSGSKKKFWNLGMHLACCSMSVAIFSGILGYQIVQSLSWMSKSGVEYTPKLMEILLWHLSPMILCGFCYLAFLIGYCVLYFRSLYRIFRLFEPRNALLLLILSLPFWAEPVILLVLSGRKPVYQCENENRASS